MCRGYPGALEAIWMTEVQGGHAAGTETQTVPPANSGQPPAGSGGIVSSSTPASNPPWWARTKAKVIFLAGILTTLVTVLTFPEKAKKAYDVSLQTLAGTQRPALALWYGYVGGRAGKSL